MFRLHFVTFCIDDGAGGERGCAKDEQRSMFLVGRAIISNTIFRDTWFLSIYILTRPAILVLFRAAPFRRRLIKLRSNSSYDKTVRNLFNITLLRTILAHLTRLSAFLMGSDYILFKLHVYKANASLGSSYCVSFFFSPTSDVRQRYFIFTHDCTLETARRGIHPFVGFLLTDDYRRQYVGSDFTDCLQRRKLLLSCELDFTFDIGHY